MTIVKDQPVTLEYVFELARQLPLQERLQLLERLQLISLLEKQSTDNQARVLALLNAWLHDTSATEADDTLSVLRATMPEDFPDSLSDTESEKP